jgi:peptidyl-prolyl cis-trans isomerase SurA
MHKIFLTLVLATLLNAQVYDGVAIVVKDKAITLMDIRKEMENSKVNLEKASDALIRQKLEEIEIDDRKISVDASEVYDDIKKTAARNNLNISEFYEAVRNSNGMSSTELKEKVKQKLLSQKLYSAISYSAISEPSEDDVREYYELHKDDYKHPSEFTVIIYQAKEQSRLQEKIDNPMFYSPDIHTEEQTLPYERISPELASLLERTALNNFTTIVPDGQKGYMSFYLKEIKSAKDSGLESVRNQIINSIMGDKREIVLSSYFARLRQSADIKTLRTPQ